MKKIILSMLVVSSLVFTSCNKDDDGPGTKNKPGTEKEPGENEGSEGTDAEVIAPDTYEFKGKDGKSNVSYSGQETRLAMASELKEALSNPQSTQEGLTKMFAEGTGFSTPDLDNPGKVLRKTVASATYSTLTTEEREDLRTKMDGWIKSFVDNNTVDASKGTAGRLSYEKNGETKYRYLTEKGVEINQAIAKTMIGGIMLDQVVNKYVSAQYLNAKKDDHEAGKPYKDDAKNNFTALEHGWDEAYGYVFGEVDGKKVFLGKYLGKVDKQTAFKGIQSEVETAFRKGRQAIVVKNYKVMHEQAKIIRLALSKAVAVRTVHYLISSQGKQKDAGVLHGLSEGYGFFHSLAFAHTKEGVQKGSKPLLHGAPNIEGGNGDNNGLWTFPDAKLKMMAEKVSEMFGFTVEQAK